MKRNQIICNLFVALLFSLNAYGSEIWQIPKIEKNTPLPQENARLNVPFELVLEHPLFSLKVPKGWSVAMLKEIETPSCETINLTPEKTFLNEKTFLSVCRKNEATKHTLQGSFDIFKKNPNRSTSFKNINGKKWVYSTESIMRSEKFRQLTAITFFDDQEWIILSNVPEEVAYKYEPIFENILQSFQHK